MVYNYFMNLIDNELKIQDDAVKWISDKNNQQDLIQKFILDKKVFPVLSVVTFMAGSPGVGKTEYSRDYEKKINESFRIVTEIPKVKKKLLKKTKINIDDYERLIVRIDIDEIRELIPQYQKTDTIKNIKGNAHVIQKATNMGLDILRNYCLKNQISFLLDGTFGNQFSTFDKIIRKLLIKNRRIAIFFIYNNPLVSWEVTKKREFVEGRNIKKENFIDQYFKSIDNVKRIKEKFGNKIILNCVLKKGDNSEEKVYFNKVYEEIENILEKRYNFSKITREYLNDNLK